MYISKQSREYLADYILLHNSLKDEDLVLAINTFSLDTNESRDAYELLMFSIYCIILTLVDKAVWADNKIENQEIEALEEIAKIFHFITRERTLNKEYIEYQIDKIIEYNELNQQAFAEKYLNDSLTKKDPNDIKYLLYVLNNYVLLTILAVPNFDFYFTSHVLLSKVLMDLFANNKEALSMIKKDISIITISLVDIIENLKTKIPDLYNEKINNCSIYHEIKDKKVLSNNIIDNSQESVKGILTDVDPIEELNSLIGLDVVKNDVNELINLLKINKIKKERGISTSNLSLHMVFSGNPGTGKTTVARLIAKIYYKLGILSKGHLVETDRAGLVGGYVGQTAIKTKDVVESAIGGVLFIDEAYTLSNARFENDYGKEAIETILKLMEDNRENLVVIVAGYTDLMKKFVDINPGLSSRFNKYIYFEDYNEDELLKIFNSIAQKHGQIVEDVAQDYLIDYFQKRIKNEKFANARDVRNYYEKVQIKQANRLVNNKRITNEDLIMIKLEDVKDIQL